MPELTAEIETALKEYTALQQEEQKLKERKRELQERLKAHLRNDDKNIWYPEVDGIRLKVSYRSVPQVEYDEEKLRTRLGDRYHALLEPDIKKLRTELPPEAKPREAGAIATATIKPERCQTQKGPNPEFVNPSFMPL